MLKLNPQYRASRLIEVDGSRADASKLTVDNLHPFPSEYALLRYGEINKRKRYA